MQLVGLNPTDTQIQNLINEKEYDGESVSIYIFQLVTGSMCIGRKKLLESKECVLRAAVGRRQPISNYKTRWSF